MQLSPDVLVLPYGDTTQVIVRTEQAARVLDLFLSDQK